MDTPAYQHIADHLRTAIERGDYHPGDTLPKLTDLMAQYTVSKSTAAEAIALLEAEGLVEAVRRRGTVVRALPVRRRLTRARQVYRDDRGYYFDPTAQPWTALERPIVTWGRAPADVAGLLGVDPGEDVLVRDRIMGDPDTRKPMQLATSYLPAAVARGTRLAEVDTGPGGIYDLLEGMGHRPLLWSESVSARMPTPVEAARLGLVKGVPLLRIARTATGAGGTVVEVNDTRMSAEEFEIGYSIRRHPSAELG
jgi:GntR family transcriptional regulator